MTRTLAAALGVALIASVASAQPVPAPAAPLATADKAMTTLDGVSASGAVSDNDEREATIDFDQGNNYLNSGLFAQAVDKYKEALAHWDHPAIHYNLALALISLDRPLEVYDHLTEATSCGVEPLGQDKYNHAREYLRLVEGQIADIDVSCDKPGARVAVDGKEVFIAPGRYVAKVRAGMHSFLADKPGYVTRSVAPYVGPGKTFRVDLLLYTSDELTRYRRKWDRTWVPYTVIGAGALVALAGGGLELWAGSDFKQYDTAVAKCNKDNAVVNGGCSLTGTGIQSMQNSGTMKQTTGFVLYGVGGAAIVVGGVLAYINRREAYQIRPEELHGQGISIAPVVAPGVAGALVQGHF